LTGGQARPQARAIATGIRRTFLAPGKIGWTAKNSRIVIVIAYPRMSLRIWARV
jgi:hypothetical protein